ncbi:hypothetical protein F7R21_19035 [Burkholderia latens]|uniref:Uncharacterized protein n=1 Tax=Burkholderia latens TaxID=488446 RepID=A0A6H9SRH7_9BURK|nr:hypothetical protein F7R21_19035 [Burkholderia latens]
MLTFCRRCRMLKGTRKPGVGPVACYRGAAPAVVPIGGRGRCAPDGLSVCRKAAARPWRRGRAGSAHGR